MAGSVLTGVTAGGAAHADTSCLPPIVVGHGVGLDYKGHAGDLYMGYIGGTACRQVYAEIHWDSGWLNKYGHNFNGSIGLYYEGSRWGRVGWHSYDSAGMLWWTSDLIKIDTNTDPKAFSGAADFNLPLAAVPNSLCYVAHPYTDTHSFTNGGNTGSTGAPCAPS
ncbi:hypothetical protein [Actinoallomurus rhizosphaericola]|uniref:hypothetical protein n=1 Tax=Actinoallomurus rhizosphaericola TaxID=2952536 RepID=UPI002091EB65|nr:hypothetical protein [Actinoallomurus rhizosphaericola]MCO5998453.1 hypothetical protein [Actinoallomurus rhizosphaericola]